MRTLPKLPKPLSPAERPVAGPTWPDEYIERWAAVYLEPENNRVLRARSVRFETFLRAPVEILFAVRAWRAHQAAHGLLPAQRKVRQREDQRSALEDIAEASLTYVAAEAHCANGRMVEKLRNHAHPRHGLRAFFRGREQ